MPRRLQPAISRAQYTRKATLPLRQAVASALAEFLGGLTFDTGGNSFPFAKVFTEWADYMDSAMYPSAVVLPGSWPYADSGIGAPRLLEETVEPRDADGNMLGVGWGLYKQAEIDAQLELRFSANTPAERDACLLKLEEVFHARELGDTAVEALRNELVLPLPAYYSLPARYAVASARMEDDADSAIRNVREAVLVLSVQASQVVVGPVYPMDLTWHTDT